MVLVVSGPANDFGYDSSNFGLGITFELQEMFKKNKSPQKKGGKKTDKE
jgi:hypothetical protein